MSEKGISIIWTINNFLNCWQKNDECIVSPTYCIYMPEETKWKLMVFPHGVAPNADCTAFFLYRCKDCDGDQSIRVMIGIDMLSPDGSCLVEVPKIFEFQKGMRNGFKNSTYAITKDSRYLKQDSLTIRCKIIKVSYKTVNTQKIYARTIIGVDERFFSWSIENFSTMTQGKTQSFIIKSESKEDILQIKLDLTNDSEEKVCFGIFPLVRRMKYSVVKTFILNSQKQEINSGEFKCWFDNEECKMFPLIFTKKTLLENKSVYLLNNVLTLSFKLTVCTGVSFEGIEKSICECSPYLFSNTVTEKWRKCISHEKMEDCPCALITDFTSLFKDQHLSDMWLKTKLKVFPVHKSILGARSPVFRAMFSSNMKEIVNGCVDVSDLDDDTVLRFLLYIYSDKLGDLKWEDAMTLYKAADKYAVISLREKCSTFMKSNLNVENGCEALTLSDMHQDKYLKEIAQTFILKNGKEIFKSEVWKLLADTNPKLALETMMRNWNEE